MKDIELLHIVTSLDDIPEIAEKNPDTTITEDAEAIYNLSKNLLKEIQELPEDNDSADNAMVKFWEGDAEFTEKGTGSLACLMSTDGIEIEGAKRSDDGYLILKCFSCKTNPPSLLIENTLTRYECTRCGIKGSRVDYLMQTLGWSLEYTRKHLGIKE